MKKCTKCGIEKPLTEFYKNKNRKDGLKYHCKQCCRKYKNENKQQIAERMKKWKLENKDRIREYESRPEVIEKKKKYQKEYASRQDVKERKKIYKKKWDKENQDKIKQWRENNKEDINEYLKIWRNENKEKIKKHGAEYRARKSSEQPACIYEIRNSINNKVYIGETKRGKLRWRGHLTRLRGNYHSNYILQQDFNEHGEDAFEWSIIKELPKDKDQLLLEEAREIQKRTNNGDDLYNLMLSIEQLKMLNENKEK